MKTKNIVIIVVVVLILAIGIGIWIWLAGRKPTSTLTPTPTPTATMGEEEEEEEEEEENPYNSAEEVKPASDFGAALHNDFKAVFGSIFGGAKLTNASSDKYTEGFSYIVKREITEGDAQKIKDLLEEKGYETTSASAKADKYRYEFSKEVLGKKYDDIGLNANIGKGYYQQKISITVYR